MTVMIVKTMKMPIHNQERGLVRARADLTQPQPLPAGRERPSAMKFPGDTCSGMSAT